MPLPDGRTLAKDLGRVNAARLASAGAQRSSLVAAMSLLGEVPGRAAADQLAEQIDHALGRPSHRLAVYGSLRRSQSNHGAVADLGERWSSGFVRGVLHLDGRGRTGGFPALELDAQAERQEVDVLDSAALTARWEQLDDFEGPFYRRVLASVENDAGQLNVTNVYALEP